jgi:Fe-S cluster assembly protein SufD
MTTTLDEGSLATGRKRMSDVAQQQSVYLAEFERLNRVPARGEPGWLARLRRDGLDHFSRLGFPTTRHEEWRFTNVAPLARTPFRLPARERGAGVGDDAIAQFAWSDGAAEPQRFICVNGRFAAHRAQAGALPEGVRVRSLRDVLASDPEAVEPHLGRLAAIDAHAFAALNTAFLREGVVVQIADGVVLREPIHLLFVSIAPAEPTVSHPRVLVLAGDSSQATIVEAYAGVPGAGYLTNALTEIVAGENAVIDHYKVQQETASAYHMAGMYLRLARSCTFSSHAFTLGGAIVRNDIVAVLDGEGVDCTLNGLYVGGGEDLVDNHTTIDHAMPHCGSHEVYKGILHGRARGVFNGKILVRPDAQKTDAKQTNKALLLSDTAQVNSKPQLEIFADDVKCTHGATVGQLDAEAWFYLRARGIGRHEARNLLIHAFAGDIVNRVKIEPLRARLDQALLAALPDEVRG